MIDLKRISGPAYASITKRGFLCQLHRDLEEAKVIRKK
jgi:hypothetical protein